jgi:sigma-70-like protein
VDDREPPGPPPESRVPPPRRRARSIITGRISLRERAAAAAANPYPLDAERPTTRGECVDGPRPCPWVTCRHNLYLDVVESGSIRLNFPDQEPWEVEYSCSLDEADAGGRVLEEVGYRMNLTRERVRQVERSALAKVAVYADSLPDARDFDAPDTGEADEPVPDDD